MERKAKSLADIAQASKHTWSISESELYGLLNLDPESSAEEVVIERLFHITQHPDVQALDDDTRLAVIKAAQEVLGRMFVQALNDVRGDVE